MQICRVRTWALELLSWSPRACPGHRWCYLRRAINKYIYCQICFKLFKKTNNYNYNYYLDGLYYNIIRAMHLISLAFSTIDNVIGKDSIVRFPLQYFLHIASGPPPVMSLHRGRAIVQFRS